MATSQFTIYTSADVGGPGPIYGNSGSLITVLNACLVTGYSEKPAAGWLKPLTDSSSYACYQQPSGSKFTMFVNDNFIQSGMEASFTGWANMTSLTGSGNPSADSNVGAGYGQFPLPQQSITVGKVMIRKSSTSDTTSARTWIIAADNYTMYIWILAGDTAGYYSHVTFGDFYSLYGASDVGRCMIKGRAGEGSPNNQYDFTDVMSMGIYNAINYLTIPFPGNYLAKSAAGTGQSIGNTIKGDALVAYGLQGNYPYGCSFGGQLTSPNPTDNNLYLSYLWVVDPSNSSLRGKYRGIYQLCHNPSNFVDGQPIVGSGTFAGKTFLIIKGGYNLGMWCLETSNTVLTN